MEQILNSLAFYYYNQYSSIMLSIKVFKNDGVNFMNKIIYYLLLLSFSLGLAIGITNNILDFKFISSSLIVFFLSYYLYKRRTTKFDFYSLLGLVFIIFTSFILWEYRSALGIREIIFTITIAAFILVSHRFIISKTQ